MTSANLEAERFAPVRRVKPPPVEVVNAAEMAELSRFFRTAKPLGLEPAEAPGTDVDLAACTIGRAWLEIASRAGALTTAVAVQRSR